MDKTIYQVFDEFLEEQRARLKPRTYRGYEDAIAFFADYLDGYAYQHLDGEDRELYERLHEEDKDFCEVFEPGKIGAIELSEFLEDFMIRKVFPGKTFMETVCRVMRKFVRWMGERGYLDEGEYEATSRVVEDLRGVLPKAEELSDLLFDYISYQMEPVDEVDETVSGDFRATRVEPGELWLEECLSGKNIGPIPVSSEISSLCEVGWVIYLVLGKTSDGWRLLEGGNVYPR